MKELKKVILKNIFENFQRLCPGDYTKVISTLADNH